jgi:putative membrane protein
MPPPMYLTDADRRAIDAQITSLEAHTGVQVVAAVVGKADTYAEAPWSAFALGAAAAGLAVVAVDAAWPQWTTAQTALLQAMVMLGTGAACALLAIAAPPFARLFVRAARREVEVRQYAESMFLKHELFGARDRVGVLVLVSLFERRVEIVPDAGFRGRVSEADWRTVAAPIAARLREAGSGPALQDGLAALDALLVARGFTPRAGADDLPNRPIEERGV